MTVIFATDMVNYNHEIEFHYSKTFFLYFEILIQKKILPNLLTYLPGHQYPAAENRILTTTECISFFITSISNYFV